MLICSYCEPVGFLQYTVIPVSLRNAPEHFQSLVSKVMGGVSNCRACLDDFVVCSDDWLRHMTTLREVFTHLSLNLAKCEFGKGTVPHLVQQVGRGQVRPVCAKISAITTFPTPTTRRAWHRFLGMAGSNAKPIQAFTDQIPIVLLYRTHNHNQCLMRWSLIFQNSLSLTHSHINPS